jgi:hypothetical protein
LSISNPNDVDYVLRRCIKGVASPTHNLRHPACHDLFDASCSCFPGSYLICDLHIFPSDQSVCIYRSICAHFVPPFGDWDYIFLVSSMLLFFKWSLGLIVICFNLIRCSLNFLCSAEFVKACPYRLHECFLDSVPCPQRGVLLHPNAVLR